MFMVGAPLLVMELTGGFLGGIKTTGLWYRTSNRDDEESRLSLGDIVVRGADVKYQVPPLHRWQG